MVPREGLEPTTSPLGRACSIQLSYRGICLVGSLWPSLPTKQLFTRGLNVRAQACNQTIRLTGTIVRFRDSPLRHFRKHGLS